MTRSEKKSDTLSRLIHGRAISHPYLDQFVHPLLQRAMNIPSETFQCKEGRLKRGLSCFVGRRHACFTVIMTLNRSLSLRNFVVLFTAFLPHSLKESSDACNNSHATLLSKSRRSKVCGHFREVPMEFDRVMRRSLLRTRQHVVRTCVTVRTVVVAVGDDPAIHVHCV